MIERAFSSHLLKLVTGVDISTRAVNSSGRPGNEVEKPNCSSCAKQRGFPPINAHIEIGNRLVSNRSCSKMEVGDRPRERFHVLSLLIGV
jgi:hypothetical protein